jgi:hypothetical protein
LRPSVTTEPERLFPLEGGALEKIAGHLGKHKLLSPEFLVPEFLVAPELPPFQPLAEPAPLDRIEEALRHYGAPTFLADSIVPPAAASAVEEAISLLEIAAEVEHSLMVQYLYVAFSTSDDAANRVFRGVAIEEMGHLLTVQNLRLALGREPYFRRQDESPQPELDPYPFVLEPLSGDVLAKYVSAEAPDMSRLDNEEQRDELKAIAARAGQAAHVPLLHRVGLVYLRLFYLFQSSDDPDPMWSDANRAAAWGTRWHVSDADLNLASLSRQLANEDWPPAPTGFLLLGSKVNGVAAAREAIAEVAQQGEGKGAAQGGHFARFLAQYKRPPEPPLKVLPVPVVGVDGVSAEPAATLVRLFDVRYELLLINLQQLFLYGEADAAPRSLALDWCQREMKEIVRRFHRLLSLLPREAGGDAKVAPAAPMYRMPPTPIPGDRETLRSRLRTVLDVGAALIAALRDAPVGAEARPLLTDLLNIMDEIDEERREAIDTL